MRKSYSTVLALFVLIGANAQNDTLTDHFTGTSFAYFTYPTNLGGGYLTGPNGFGDLACVQRFTSASNGVPSTGTIKEVLLHLPLKSGTGNFEVVLYGDNGGLPGAELASRTISIANVDTVLANAVAVGGPLANGDVCLFNVIVDFNTAIPAGGTFYAGIKHPTTAASGDTVVLSNTADNANGLSADDALTLYADNATWQSFNGLASVGLSIFPIVEAESSASTIDEDLAVSVYPNPATTVVMFEIADYTNVNTVEVFNLSGQSVLTADITSSTTTIDVSTLNKGVYFYNIKGANGETLSTNKLVVTK